MDVYFDSKVFAKVPDTMSIGDTIITNSGVFEIITKTIDIAEQPAYLYCKAQRYKEPNISVCDMFEQIYGSSTFTTSGSNTNEIENNPRLIILFIIASVIIDGNHLKVMADEYRRSIISMWNSIDIPWLDIFTDDPISVKDKDEATPIISELLESSKIPTTMWPAELQIN